MGCDKIETALLQDYLEGTIDPVGKIFLEDHINSCRDCRRELSELKLMFWELNDKNNYETEFPGELDDMGKDIVAAVLGDESKSIAKKVIDMQVNNIKLTGNLLGHIPGARQTPKILKKASKGITKSIAKGFTKGVKKMLEAR